MRRRRGPGLLGTMAVGGAAYAVGSSRAKGAAQERDQNRQIAELQAQQAATQQQPMQTAPPPPPAAPASAGMSMDDKIAQLKQLGELKSAGVLSETEFEAQKAKILAS